MKFHVYLDSDGLWRWQHTSADGEVIATSGEGYVNEADCLAAIQIIKSSVNDPVVVE